MTDALPSAQPKKARPDLKLIDLDENYQAPPGASPAEQVKSREAAAIREGIRRQKVRTATERATLTAAHAAALQGAQQAYEHAASKANKAGHAHGFWKGIGYGMFVMFITAGVGFALYAAAVIRPAFEAAGQFRMQDQVVRGIDRQVNPPEPDYRQPQP